MQKNSKKKKKKRDKKEVIKEKNFGILFWLLEIIEQIFQRAILTKIKGFIRILFRLLILIIIKKLFCKQMSKIPKAKKLVLALATSELAINICKKAKNMIILDWISCIYY